MSIQRLKVSDLSDLDHEIIIVVKLSRCLSLNFNIIAHANNTYYYNVIMMVFGNVYWSVYLALTSVFINTFVDLPTTIILFNQQRSQQCVRVLALLTLKALYSRRPLCLHLIIIFSI